MTIDKIIIEEAKKREKQSIFSDLAKSIQSRGVWSAYGVGFIDGAVFATEMIIEKACDDYCRVCGHYPHTVPFEICRNSCDYYSDFRALLKNLSKKSMKGGKE